jgi:hypothetical protein
VASAGGHPETGELRNNSASALNSKLAIFRLFLRTDFAGRVNLFFLNPNPDAYSARNLEWIWFIALERCSISQWPFAPIGKMADPGRPEAYCLSTAILKIKDLTVVWPQQ